MKKKTAFALILTCKLILLIGLASAFVPEEGCNLQLTKSVDKFTAEPGDTLTFTISYENIGNLNCTGGGVKIQDVLNENLLYEGEYNVNIQNDADGQGFFYGWQEIPGYNETTKSLTWNVYLVSPGEEGTITFEATILEREVCGDFEISNYFKAWSDQEGWKDSNTVAVNVNDECPPEPFCGDNTCNNGETCSICPNDCDVCPPVCPICGNGIKETGEECDDENLVNGDGCSRFCYIEKDDPNCDEECDNCNDKKDSDNFVELCNVDWVCSGWSECVNGAMTRECIDENNCNEEYNKPYEQTSCNDKIISTGYTQFDKRSSSLLNIWVIIGIIIFVILLIFLILLIA